ncbi:MAG: hypothetical protein ACYTKD_06235 [Planctomycetota bacterium]|jgi:hypothetical protein
MDEAGPVLIFILIACAVGFFIWFAYYLERIRREAMAALAARLGYDFSAGDPWDIPDRHDFTDLFSRGHSRRAWNVINGERDGVRVMLFDYRYTTGSGKNKSTHSRTPVVLEMPGQDFPGFYLRREGFFDKVAAAVGFDDIDFESNEFSKRYYVKCADKRFAYDVVNARQMEFLLELDDMNVEMAGDSLVFHLESKLEPDGLEWLHGAALEFVSNIPGFALERTGGRGSGR